MTIDRCLCHGRRFAELEPLARASGVRSVAALQAAGGDFGRGCGLCHPYVRRMLRTGQTVFHAIVTDADEPPDA